MSPRRDFLVAGAVWVALSVIGVVLVAGIQIIPVIASREAAIENSAFVLLTAASVPVLMFVVVGLAYSVLRFRATDEMVDGPPVHGHATFQAAWLGISLLLVLGLFVYGALGLVEIRGAQTADFEVNVQAEQWAWHFEYPATGVMSKELHIPVDRRVHLKITSIDVIHSFWVPAFGIKQDAVPGRPTQIYMTATDLGTYPGMCAELCGLGHTTMLTTTVVSDQATLDAWLSQQPKVPAVGGSIAMIASHRRSVVPGPGLLRAVIGAGIGFAIGGGGLALGLHAEAGQIFGLGYLFGLLGFLLGIGAFRFWLTWAAGREIDAGEEHAAHGRAGDWLRYFRFTTDHKVIGIQYLVTAFVLFLVAGTAAMFMRFELAQPGVATSKDLYNMIMSTHGAMMITVALVSIIGGLGNYLVPLMVGARDMAFPKANALSYWMLPLAVLLVAINPLLGGFDTGWTAYPPLSQQANLGQQAYLMAFITVGVSSILSAINFLVTVFRMRAPGMSLMRMPIFVWALTVTAALALVATSIVAMAFTMLLFDRLLGTAFFRASRGGDVILFQHLFWFYSHPAVYIMGLPGLGAILEVVPVFARKPLFAYPLAVLMFISIGVMSFTVWAHHMFVSGMATFFHIPIMLTTELISVPTGIVFLSALGTIWMGRLHFKVPMLWVFGFLWAFLIGGITGVFLADVPTDITLSDTYFVVAHFHYTIVGGTIFGLFAGTYYWFPKITGRMYSERLGRLHFWWFTLAFNATFLPMFWLGIEGMRRRVADYPAGLGAVNLFVSIAAFNIFLSMAVFVFNMVWSWRRGLKAAPNPWRAQTLEWQVASPPPVENFDQIPTVTATPYQYGSLGAAPADGHSAP